MGSIFNNIAVIVVRIKQEKSFPVQHSIPPEIAPLSVLAECNAG